MTDLHFCSFIPTYLPKHGGAQLGLHEALRRIASATSHRVSVVTPTTDRRLPRLELIDRVEVHRYRRPDIWANWYAPTMIGVPAAMRAVRRLKPDLVHASYVLPTGLGAFIAARRHRLPFVISLIGNDIQDPNNEPPPPLYRVASSVTRSTPIIVANSSAARDVIEHRMGAAASCIRVIPYGVDIDRFRPDNSRVKVRSSLGISREAVVLLALQRLEPRKGLEVLLQSVSLLRRRGADFKLVIAGRGSERERLAELARKLGVDDVVIFAGFISEEVKAAFYSASDLFILSSTYEGLGIVLAEASSSGLPVVATSAGGTADVVVDGQTGVLVAPNDPEALATAIGPLIESSTLREQLGRAGRARMVQRFNVNVVAEQYLQTFLEAVGRVEGIRER